MLKVGDKYEYEFSYTQQDVELFARVTGDNNPIHIDAEFAKMTPFGRPIMHGFLSGAVFSKVFGTLFPGQGTIYMSQEMKFRAPMFVDTKYKALFEVTLIMPRNIRAPYRAVSSTVRVKIVSRARRC